jgi:hypothetical protein
MSGTPFLIFLPGLLLQVMEVFNFTVGEPMRPGDGFGMRPPFFEIMIITESFQP